MSRLVEAHRGGRPAAAYARAHNAGTVGDHIGRYRLLADFGVQTVFVAFPDLSGPEEIERFAPVVTAFGSDSLDRGLERESLTPSPLARLGWRRVEVPAGSPSSRTG